MEKVQIPIVAQPNLLQLNDTRVFVVNKDNYEEFAKEFTEIYGELAFVALSMKDYENLALNIADIKRYVEQQKEIILYYEKAVTEQPEEKNPTIDMIIDLAITWWQFTVVGILIAIGFIANLFSIDNDKELVGFEYTEMIPHMQPITIPTVPERFLGCIMDVVDRK